MRGEIDLFTAPELKQVLAESIENGRVRIIVDLTETTFLDSTALGVLIGAVKRLRSRDGALAIVNTDDNIAKTFEITGLDQIFTILPPARRPSRPSRRPTIRPADKQPHAAQGAAQGQASRRSSTASSIGPWIAVPSRPPRSRRARA